MGTFSRRGKRNAYTPDVALGEKGYYTPLPTISGASRLNMVFSKGVEALSLGISDPRSRDGRNFHSRNASQGI